MTEFKPTHFIEEYTPNTWIKENHSVRYPLLLSDLDYQLAKTKEVGLETIAIFKIQLKNDDKNNS